MNGELEYSFNQFKDALSSLKQGASSAKSELEKDGVIQRFEFTFEMLWKAMKTYLAYKGIECKSPKDCLKAAFQYGLIDNEEIFLDMLEDRNNTSHLYSKEDSERIFTKIKGDYVKELESLLKSLLKSLPQK